MARVRSGLTLIGTIGLAAALTAQGRNRPPSSSSTIEAVAQFRCEGAASDGQCGSPADGSDNGVDRARGDSLGPYNYYHVLSGKQGLLTNKTGAFIESNGLVWIRVSPLTPGVGSRYLQLLVGTPTEHQAGDTLPCEALGNCSPTGRPGGLVDLTDAQLRAKPVTAFWEDLPGGIFSLSCGQSSAAIVDFTFPDANANGHWGLNFNPRGPAEGSTFAQVERTALRAWTVRVTAGHRAELIGFNHSGSRGKQSREGLYALPFEVYVTTKDPNASLPPPPDATCSQ